MGRAEMCRFVMGLGVALCAAGCGASNMEVEALRPRLQVQGRAEARGTKIAVGAFEDGRTDASGLLIGEAKTGFFNFSTNIIADESADVMVAEAVHEGLRKAGFAIVEPSEADYVVTGEIAKFWVEEYATGVSLEYAKAYVKYDLLVKDAQGKIVWGITVDEYIVSDNCWDATVFDIPTLTRALRNSVEAIFRDESFWQAVAPEVRDMRPIAATRALVNASGRRAWSSLNGMPVRHARR